MRKIVLAMVVLFGTGATIGQQATMKTFFVNDETKRDVVTFTSKAPLETIVGRTGDVLGFVAVDPKDIKGTAKARFEVDLTSLKTGIDLRDQHMREQYLETDKFPKAIFELVRVVSTSQNMLEDQKEISLILEGDFTVHGVTRRISLPVSVTYFAETEQTRARLAGDLLHIVGEFTVVLKDYQIKRPQFVILKLDENQKVSIDLFAATGSPAVEFATTK